MKKEDAMATKKITIERFSITSTEPFAEVVSAIAAQVGHPDICLIASYGNAEALEVAGALDNKVERLLLEAAQ